MGMMRVGFHKAAQLWEEDEIGLSEFFKLIQLDLEKIAKRLMQRWRTPSSVDLEDVVQELRVGCCRHLRKYDRNYPGAATIGQFVLFNACSDAKKWMHRQRGASLHGTADKNLGHIPLFLEDVGMHDHRVTASRSTANRFAVGGIAEVFIDTLITAPNQEMEVERKEKWLVKIEKAPTKKLRYALLALATSRCEPMEASDLLYQNLDVRLRLRLSNRDHADRVIQSAMKWLQKAA